MSTLPRGEINMLQLIIVKMHWKVTSKLAPGLLSTSLLNNSLLDKLPMSISSLDTKPSITMAKLVQHAELKPRHAHIVLAPYINSSQNVYAYLLFPKKPSYKLPVIILGHKIFSCSAKNCNLQPNRIQQNPTFKALAEYYWNKMYWVRTKTYRDEWAKIGMLYPAFLIDSSSSPNFGWDTAANTSERRVPATAHITSSLFSFPGNLSRRWNLSLTWALLK